MRKLLLFYILFSGMLRSETSLLRWFKQASDQNIAVIDPIILEKSKCFAEQLRIEELKQSTGW
jgi:hypothetical protein